MSRIGKKHIIIPEGVEVSIDDNKVTVKGSKGEIGRIIRPEIKIEKKDNEIIVAPGKETKRTNALWGLSRTLIFNMIEGVTKGYEKKLEIQGVGYKANLEGEDLVLNVGFSHLVRVNKVEGIKFEVEKNIITVSGVDKELVGQITAKIRKIKKPEPYKGKGIRYLGEEVRRKSGKKAAGSEGAK
ncbi:MAG: 50S ribosomal protein L6 [Candidatus Nealsonbacteria bacterium RBG_13_37_56]|uniref:Large ribosomal subunit protein uL6 n=1 Tax=Candidatus Nealsonbacteria bacterium RBG_13_37_56 TaxID=1801661 RepID=A0A1G2DXV1_9BACT|nr:MAG: 50S ribosomal protein L6 [Candidatus Nealsonbacteria bacterium RBG_13_37_56]